MKITKCMAQRCEDRSCDDNGRPPHGTKELGVMKRIDNSQEGTCQPCPLGSSSSILDLHVSLPIRKRDGLNSNACTWESKEPPTPIQTESLLRDDGSEVLVQSTRN